VSSFQTKRWHVLGAGAIGCLFADALACDTTLLLRGGAAPGERQLRVERGDNQSERTVSVQAATASGTIDHLLVTTKAYDAATAVRSLAQRLGPDSVVVLLVNGMGVAEEIRPLLPTDRIYAGTTTEGAYRLAPLHIRHAGRGATHIGSLSASLPATPPWFSAFEASELDCTWEREINAALWQKLAVNCVINPLTALHRCQNGELSRRADLASEVEALCQEIMQVSVAAGFTQTARKLRRSVATVIAGTADNRSSMLEDVENARPTEIEYITGYLLDTAARHGIDAAHNRELYEKVKTLA